MNLLTLLEKVFFFRFYVDLVFKRESKAISVEKLYAKVENLIKKQKPSFTGLSDFEKGEINKVLADGVAHFNYYKTPADNYIAIYKTSFRRGRFHGNRRG